MSILFWFFLALGTFIVGIIISLVGYYLFSSIGNWGQKRRYKNIQSDFGLDGLATKGNVIIDQKEVERDERTRIDKFREFERLRQLATKDQGVGRDESGQRDIKDLTKYPTGQPLPPLPPLKPGSTEYDPTADRKDTKRTFEIPSPDF